MNKEELIHMHAFMVLIKDFFEKKGKGEFSKYYSLQISPIHIHRHKDEHKNAVFTLGKEILSAIHDESNNIVSGSNMIVYDPNMIVYDPNNIVSDQNNIVSDPVNDPHNIVKYEKNRR